MIDTKDGGGAAWGDCGEGPRGQEVTREGFFSKKKKKKRRIKAQPRGDRRCGREALHAPTGDTGVHFLWNVSGIPGSQPTSTTSLARGTRPPTGSCVDSSAGKLHPKCLPPATVASRGFH